VVSRRKRWRPLRTRRRSKALKSATPRSIPRARRSGNGRLHRRVDRAQHLVVARATCQSVRQRASGLTAGAGKEILEDRPPGLRQQPHDRSSRVLDTAGGGPRNTKCQATSGWSEGANRSAGARISRQVHRGGEGLRRRAGRATPVARPSRARRGRAMRRLGVGHFGAIAAPGNGEHAPRCRRRRDTVCSRQPASSLR